MSSQVVTVTVQAALFSALSSTLAQAPTVYRHQKISLVDPVPFFNFIFIAIITTPPNYWYQRLLEDVFPSTTRPKEAQEKHSDRHASREQNEQLSISNTFIKFILDQSFGAAVNTVMFIVLTGLLKGKTLSTIGIDIEREFWPMLTTGYRLWPLVTLLNLIVVPFEYRMLFGNMAAVLWGVYLNLKTA